MTILKQKQVAITVWNYRDHLIELKYVDGDKKTGSCFDAELDLVDEYGIKGTDSYYCALAIQSDKLMYSAHGLTQECAIHNLYSEMAKYDALADIEKHIYEISQD
jgi:hypothetical protein